MCYEDFQALKWSVFETLSFKSRIKIVFLQTLLLATLFTLLMTLSPNTPFSAAFPGSTEYFVSVDPVRIQEGLNTSITVGLREANANTTYTFKINVTAPTDDSYIANVTVSTNGTGYGSNMTEFWSGFAPPANTNYTGVYQITVNDTLATSSFAVGLTDKLTYLRSEIVNIRGAGYNASEAVQIDIKFGGASVAGFPKNVPARPSGVVVYPWVVPTNASPGVYTLTLANATTGGTVKPVADVQTFTIEGICEILTRNLANETITGVSVEVYNATSGAFLNLSQKTNQTGWARFILAGGNYTFRGFWNFEQRDVEVGAFNLTVTGNATFPIQAYMKVWLSNIKLTVTDEAANPLPLIDLNLKYNLTAKGGIGFLKTDSFTTNITGSVQTVNMFSNTSYLIEARRYGFLFNTTSINGLSGGWNNITIIAPTYTLFVQVVDSRDTPAVGIKVAAYDWSSGIGAKPLQQEQTNSDGNVTLSLTFGKYRLRVYSDTTFLNEVTVNLIQNQSSLVVHSDVYNVTLNVLVVDYFGQPIPNVVVEFQRKADSDYETTQTKTTGSNGAASFNGIIGGDSRVYTSVAGGPGEIRYLNLVEPTMDVVFELGSYTVVAGYALDTSQFVTLVILLLTVVAFLVASNYKRIPRLFQRGKK